MAAFDLYSFIRTNYVDFPLFATKVNCAQNITNPQKASVIILTSRSAIELSALRREKLKITKSSSFSPFLMTTKLCRHIVSML